MNNLINSLEEKKKELNTIIGNLSIIEDNIADKTCGISFCDSCIFGKFEKCPYIELGYAIRDIKETIGDV